MFKKSYTEHNINSQNHVYSVDLEVWSKLTEHAHIKLTASKCACDFDCDWERVNAFSHCVTLTRVQLPQIISCSDAKVRVLVVMEYKRASVLYVYEIFLLHTCTSRSTEFSIHCSFSKYVQYKTFHKRETDILCPTSYHSIHWTTS